MELREKIAELALWLLPAGLHPSVQHQKCLTLADSILAIPEIAEALAAFDPDAATGCADDKVWADVPVEALREATQSLKQP